ncbi:MAG: MerR family transcriptional regulator [Bifidobacteriaceae bacterium]|nr:MerR family transcriptional regulator [Bifidobacteriaceae bacterium]
MATYTIGQMAEKMGVATSTLRYYDKEGLLPFVERTPGGARIFCDSDMEMLNVIGCLKAGGMPIKDIKKYVDLCGEGDSTIGARLDLIRKQREHVVEEIAELRKSLDVLDYKLWFYETADASGSCDMAKAVPDDQLEPRLRMVRHELQRFA